MSALPSPFGESAAPTGARPWGLIVLVTALFVVRLALGANLHLTEDEAYYRLWAQAPALGYYDHPPMVAWWIWLGVHLVGDNPLGVRLLPIVSCALSTVLVYDVARLAGGAPADSERAGVWYNAMPLVAAGGFLAVPDASAAFFWILSLWATLKALRDQALGWWLMAGAAAGLATLSKYSALFLGPGVLIWMAWTPSGRSSLSRPGPWMALGVAASLFGLNLWWNADHHWLTLVKQFGRIAPHRLAPRYLVEFVATEALLLNPLLAIFVARLLGAGPNDQKNRPNLEPFVATSLPFVGYLLAHSLHDRIQAHWPAPVYPAIAICAAFAASRAGRGWKRARHWVPAVGLGAAGIIAAFVSLPMIGLPIPLDPAAPIRGWPSFAGDVESLRVKTGAGWVATTSYGLAAQLADEPGISAPVLQINERARWVGLKQGAWADVTRPGLLVELQRRIDLAGLRRCFRTVRPLTVLERGAPGAPKKAYSAIWLDRPIRNVVREGCDGAAAPPISGFAGVRVPGGAGPASSGASPG